MSFSDIPRGLVRSAQSQFVEIDGIRLPVKLLVAVAMDEREGYSVSAPTTPPVPLRSAECSDSEGMEYEMHPDGYDPRDELIDSFKRELQQLRNRLATKDQEISELHLEAQKQKVIKKESTKIVSELHKARSLLQEEQEHLKESRAQVEQLQRAAAQAEQYKAQAEQLQRAAADASAASAVAAAELKHVKAHEVELEEELRNSRATVEQLRSKLESLRKSQELAEAAQAEAIQAAQPQSQLSPKLQAANVTVVPPVNGNGKSPASARPAKNIHMVPTSGSVDLVPKGVTRFTEMPMSSGGAAL